MLESTEWAVDLLPRLGRKSQLGAKHASPMGDESTWAAGPPGGSVPAVTVVEDRDRVKAYVAARLVVGMDEAAMSISRLADVLGVDRSDVRRWRNGKVFPAYKIHSIADALGKPVDWFFPPRDEDDA